MYHWDPVIAPSGAQFYDGPAFPHWRGSLFTGNLKDRRLVRLSLDKGRVTGEEHLLPIGALYIVTDERNGELWKLVPRR